MATDFVVLRELIAGRDDRSYWLCGTSIRKDSETFLLGDPACDRILFQPPPFETVHQAPPIALRAKYLNEVNMRAANLTKEDVMVLVLVGHGEDGGIFVIGDEDNNCRLTKLELEESAWNEGQSLAYQYRVLLRGLGKPALVATCCRRTWSRGSVISRFRFREDQGRFLCECTPRGARG
jgi:hypothetical protein